MSKIEATAAVDTTLMHLGLLFENVCLFKREEQIERVLRMLEFPRLLPKTFMLVGSPATAKTRFLASFSGLFHGQQLPVGIISCSPERQQVPFSLIIALLNKFLVTYSPMRIEQWVGPTLVMNPWLAWLFRTLQGTNNPPVPPEDPSVLYHGLEAMLMGILREAPHLGIIYNLHQGDAESLELLRAVQGRAKHGLRILATIELDAAGALPAELKLWKTVHPETIELPTIPLEALHEYLEEFGEEIVTDEMAEHLHLNGEGLLLRMEATLRAWVLNGTLTFNGDVWTYHAPPPEQRLLPRDEMFNERLAQIALLGTTSQAVLELLWELPAATTAEIVTRGRQLGHLRPAPEDDPDVVEVCDLDQRDYLVGLLTPELRQEMHRRIVTLFEHAAAREAQPGYAQFPLAYHMQAAGMGEEAKAYLRANQRSLQEILAETEEQTSDTPEFPGLQRWDLPPPDEVNDETADLIVKASTAIRLAAVQYHLYPLHCQPVRERTRQAMLSLERLLARRPSLIITFDGKTIAFDGIFMKRQELAVVTRDYARWMKEGCLHAIGIAHGIRSDEISRFLHTLVNHEPKAGVVGLLSKVASLNLLHLKVHTGFFTAPALADTVYDESLDDALTHSNILAFLVTGVTPEEAQAHLDHLGQVGAQEGDADGTAGNTDDFTVTRATWAALPEKLSRASAHIRRLLIASVLQWFKPYRDEIDAQPLPDDYDAVICTQLLSETDEDAVADLLAFSRGRLEYLMTQHQWPEVLAYFRTITRRHSQDTNARVHKGLSEFRKDIVAGEAFEKLFTGLDNSAETLAMLREVVAMLGVVAIRPMLTRLSRAEQSRERLALVQHLCVLCAGYEHLLVQELKAAYPWYYYRNVLTILAAVGTDASLAAVSEKVGHPEPRVRAEAITTAVTLAKDRAATYLIYSLKDSDQAVRARAAGIAWQCPHPEIRDLLIGLLRRHLLGGEQPESVQLVACAALGKYPDPEARHTLVQIVTSSLLSPFARRPELVQLAALDALGQHLDDPGARAAVEQTLRHKNPLLRQAAQKLHDKHREKFATTV